MLFAACDGAATSGVTNQRERGFKHQHQKGKGRFGVVGRLVDRPVGLLQRQHLLSPLLSGDDGASGNPVADRPDLALG